MKRRRLSTLLLLLVSAVLLVLRYAFAVSWGARAAAALLLGAFVIRWGLASLRPMQVGTKNFDPVDVVVQEGLPIYSCTGCGTQLLLLRKGNDKPPRHCGEPMRYAVVPADDASGASDYPPADIG